MTMDRAFAIVQAGGTINGPGGPIDNTPPISKEEFSRKYLGAARHLIPTYDVIDTNSDGVFEPINTSNPLGNTVVNDLMTDLNQNGNAWLNNVGKAHIVYSTEVKTVDRLVKRTGPIPDRFLKQEILSLDSYLGTFPGSSEVWYEEIVSGHGGDGTVSTYSSVDPFLGDPNLGTKLLLKPITGAAAGVDEVGHGGLINNDYSQTQILKSVGATNFDNLDLATNLEKAYSQASLTFLQTKLLRPADALNEAAQRLSRSSRVF